MGLLVHSVCVCVITLDWSDNDVKQAKQIQLRTQLLRGASGDVWGMLNIDGSMAATFVHLSEGDHISSR